MSDMDLYIERYIHLHTFAELTRALARKNAKITQLRAELAAAKEREQKLAKPQAGKTT